MAATLVDSFRSLLTPEAVSAIATRVGQPEVSVSRGLTAGFGAVMLGLLTKVNDPTVLRDVHGLATEAATATEAGAKGLGSLLAGDDATLASLGSRLLSTILGGHASVLTEAVGRTSGLNSATASSLMSMVAPLVLGLLGNRVKGEALSTGGLAALLSSEATSIRNAAPAGLATVLSSAPSIASQRSTAVSDESRRSGAAWSWLAVAAAVILAIAWFAARSRGPASDRVAMDTSMAPALATDSADVQAYSPSDVNVILPNGTTLNEPARSLESQLVAFIQDSSASVDTTTWFDFDRLSFEAGSTTLAPESDGQLRNVVAILAAYPAVHARIGAFADSTGDAKADQKLSVARAQSVMNQLIALGVGRGQLKAEGFGDQHATADSSTVEGRSSSQRVALGVTQK